MNAIFSMANSPRSSWKQKRDRLIRLDFIGRQEHLTAFRASVTDPEAATMIFAISGQGGVGKTTLLKEFRRITEEGGQIAAYVDEGSATNRVEDVPEALYRLAKDFETQNSAYKFEKFHERYKTYRQKRQELEADPEAPSGMASGIGRAGTKLVLGGVKAIPGVGEMMGEFVDSNAVAEKGGELLSFAWSKLRNQDEVQLVTEPLEVLTPLFLEEINRIATKQRVVLLLDTYEVTGKFLDDWLRAVLDLRYGEDLTDNFRLCIAGRDPLDRNAWATLEPCIARSPLEPFTEEETRCFLQSKGVTSEAVIDQIWKLSSGGLPLLVSMMAQNAPTEIDAVIDPCELAVERFLKWETEPTKQQLAQEAALPRVLNRDVVAVLGDPVGDGQFEWLKQCAFVVRDGERWRYHLVVREQMLRYQWQKSPQRWAAVHGKLAAYYDSLRQGLGLEATQQVKDKTWQKASLEWLYHDLCTQPQAKVNLALNGFLTALKTSRAFAQDWAGVMVQAGQEARCETLQCWGERLRYGLVAHQEKRYEEAIPTMTALLAEPGIPANLKAIALDWRGCWYRWSNQAELALPDFQQAVEIDGEDAEYWFDLALTYQNLKRYEEAIAAYEQAITLNPNDASYHNDLGNVYRQQKHYEKAIAAYEQAITLDPNYAYPYNNLGLVYKDQKHFDLALQAFQKALDLPDSLGTPASAHTLAHRNLGDTYTEQKYYREAISAYQQAINLDPNYAYPHNGLGIVYYDQKRYEEAIAAYQQAIALDPKYAAPHNGLGNVYKEQKRYEEAISAYQQAINLDPNFAYPHNNLGTVYQEQKHFDLALAAFQKALDLRDSLGTPASAHTLAHRNLGDVYTEQKHYEDAITAYQRAIAVNPKYADAHNGLGNVYKEQKRYEEAISAYQQAIDLEPGNSFRHNALGNVYKKQKRYEEAIATYQRAIDLDPNFAYPHNGLGIVYQEQKRYEEAIAAYQRAIALDPNFAYPHNNLGTVYQEQKRYEEAISAYQRAIDLDPEYKWAWANRGKTYHLMKRYEKAFPDFDKAIELDSEYKWAWANRGETYRLMQCYEKALQDFDKAIELDPEYAWAIARRAETYQALNRYPEALQDCDRAIELKPENDWYFYLRALTHLKLQHRDLAQLDLQQAISLVTPKIPFQIPGCSATTATPVTPIPEAEDLALSDDDWRNLVNLALYHLAAGNQPHSAALYHLALSAPEELQDEAIQDLIDFLALFPDHPIAREMELKIKNAKLKI